MALLLVGSTWRQDPPVVARSSEALLGAGRENRYRLCGGSAVGGGPAVARPSADHQPDLVLVPDLVILVAGSGGSGTLYGAGGDESPGAHVAFRLRKPVTTNRAGSQDLRCSRRSGPRRRHHAPDRRCTASIQGSWFRRRELCADMAKAAILVGIYFGQPSAPPACEVNREEPTRSSIRPPSSA